MARQIIDALDRKILQLIQSDARIPFLEVARACNVSGAAIHQRIQKLTSLGIIKGSQFIIDARFRRSPNVITPRVVTTCSSRFMRTTTTTC